MGQIFDGSTPTTFAATQSPYTSANPTPLAGNYTLLLPSADPADALLPPGTGYATVKVTALGAVSFIGKFADGVKISGGSTVIDGDVWPVYAPAFNGTGGLAGDLHFRKKAGVSEADGDLQWLRPPAQRDGLYPAGFATSLPAIASSYVAPPVDYSTATLRLDGGGFDAAFTRPLTVAAGGNSLQSSGDRSIKLAIDPKTGALTGTVTNPSTGKKVLLEGAVFQITRTARGFTQPGGAATGAAAIAP